MQTQYVFGSTWSVYFEELVTHLEPIADAPAVRPTGYSYQLVKVGGNVLFPWHYAKEPGVSPSDRLRVRPLPVLGSALLRQFGPEPEWWQDPLPAFADADEQESDAAAVTSILQEWDASPQVVIVGFAANPHAGLIHLCLGEAALTDKGDVQWRCCDDLPLPPPPASQP